MKNNPLVQLFKVEGEQEKIQAIRGKWPIFGVNNDKAL